MQFAETFGEQVQLHKQRSAAEYEGLHQSAYHRKDNSGDVADVTP